MIALPPADYTREDDEVWYFLRSKIQCYRPGYDIMRRVARHGDRRDAELMLEAVVIRWPWYGELRVIGHTWLRDVLVGGPHGYQAWPS